jgi:acetate---CoA ligase (ADP-forming)
VVVAAGGTEAEVLNDRAIELAPVDAAASLQMLQRLRCWPLLNGFRGRPRLDVDSLVQTIVGVARLAADHIDVVELEVNPVRVSEHGVIAVDALIETAPGNGTVGNFL